MRKDLKYRYFLDYWRFKSRKDLIFRIYALTRYIQRIHSILDSPFCADLSELNRFQAYLDVYMKGGKDA